MAQKISSPKELYKRYSKNYLTKKGPEVDELWYSRLIGRRISIYFTWIFLHSNITPNQITLLSLLSGLVGCVFVAIPKLSTFLIGFLFFHLYIILDSSDGEVARIRKMQSPLGKYLDRIFHVFIYLFLYSGMAFNIYFRTHDWRALLIGALTGLVMAMAAMIYYVDPLLEKLSYGELKRPDSKLHKLGNRVYNILTGDIEISIILFLTAPLFYLGRLKFDIFMVLLVLNLILLFMGGVIYGLYYKFSSKRYRDL